LNDETGFTRYPFPYRLVSSCLTHPFFASPNPKRSKPPFVIDSPHSGTIYPDDFRHDCARGDLEKAEDRYVDALFLPAAAACHIPVVQALFPRTYIDVNPGG
jgi:N-formylglutamate amidohydrolase